LCRNGAGEIKLKHLSSSIISALNALGGGGVFAVAAVVTIAPGTTLYLADVQEPFVLAGHTYEPVPMRWEGMEQTSQQGLPAVTITVANIQGQIGAYLEEHDLFGQPITLQIVHLDRMGLVTEADTLRLLMLTAEWDWTMAAVHCGLDYGLNEVLPRTLYSAEGEPGVPELRRASIL
jgi:hypothetical protein